MAAVLLGHSGASQGPHAGARGMKNRCGEGCTSEGRIVRIGGLFAVLCLLGNTPGAFAQIATAQTGQVSTYSVDGLALGERVQPNNAGYREYKCGPSHQFDGSTWCQK